jgi:soluble lytic murein transglycosylase-like protein
MGGVRYLRDLLDDFGNNLRLALAAYNAGESSVLRYGGVPPFPETINYVERVLRLQSAYRDRI